MAPTADSFSPENLRDAIVSCFLEETKLNQTPRKYSVPTRNVRNALEDLKKVNNERVFISKQKPLLQSKLHNQVYRWASKFSGAKIVKGRSFTNYEMKQLLLNDFVPKMKSEEAIEEYGFSKGSQHRYRKMLLKNLNLQDMNTAKKIPRKETPARKDRSSCFSQQ